MSSEQEMLQVIRSSAPALTFVDMSGWDDMPPPEPQYSVSDRIPRHHVTLFSGAGAAGKSTIGLHLAAAHAYGGDWLNSMPDKGPALFIDCEDGEAVIHRRLWHITQYYGCRFADLRDLHLVTLAGQDALLATATRGGKVEPTALYGHVLQAAGDLKPRTVVIASSANVFAGNEIDRAQVNQFVLGLMLKLALTADGAVVLISHPSLTGISSGSGISGSTQWHNACRARMYLRSPKANGDDSQPDSAIRQIEFMKNQYGPVSATLTLRWKNGMFLPEAAPDAFEGAVRAEHAKTAFRDELARHIAEGRPVSHNPASKNYAPRVFAKTNSSKFRDLETAMEELFRTGTIRVEPYGPPSKHWQKLIFS